MDRFSGTGMRFGASERTPLLDRGVSLFISLYFWILIVGVLSYIFSFISWLIA